MCRRGILTSSKKCDLLSQYASHLIPITRANVLFIYLFFLSPCIFGRLPGEDASLNDAAVREGLGIAPDRRKNPASPTLQSETTKIDIIVQWGGGGLS